MRDISTCSDNTRAPMDKKSPAPFVFLQSFVLASASPRRRDFFQRLGLDCPAVAADIVEEHRAGESPDDFARRMAEEKALAVARQRPDSWVLGADTIVVLGEEVLGKPRDAAEALTMLQRLNGRVHRVVSGFSLRHHNRQMCETRHATSEVFFHHFPDEVLAAYVRNGEPLDKAGTYGIQGIGAFLVREIHGSCANVIGLPLAEVIQLLLEHHIIAPS